MRVHGSRAEAQTVADVAVDQAGADQSEDVDLAGGESIWKAAGLSSRAVIQYSTMLLNVVHEVIVSISYSRHFGLRSGHVPARTWWQRSDAIPAACGRSRGYERERCAGSGITRRRSAHWSNPLPLSGVPRPVAASGCGRQMSPSAPQSHDSQRCLRSWFPPVPGIARLPPPDSLVGTALDGYRLKTATLSLPEHRQECLFQPPKSPDTCVVSDGWVA